jgi:hypothetical protein
MPSCGDCQEHTGLTKEIETIKGQIEEIFRRLLTSEMQGIRTETKLDQVIKTLNQLVADVKALTNKPAERWNQLVMAGVVAAATGVIGIVVGKLIK